MIAERFMFIVIPTHGRPTLLHRTFESLARCVLPSTFRETLVVENGGRLGVEQAVASAPSSIRVRYMYSEPANKSTALNAVLAAIPDSLVVFLDDDVRLSPDVLVAYEHAAAGRARGAFFGGPTEVDYESTPKEWLVPYLPPSARGWRWRGESCEVDSPAFLGFNWAAFRRDLLNIGGFDADFGPGSGTRSVGQETSMQARLLKAGIAGVYVPNAVVWHYVPSERCSPEWALERFYRTGIYKGLHHNAREAALMGAPRWAYRAAVQSWAKAVVASFGSDPASRFDAKRDYRIKLGFLRGCRIAAKRRRAAVVADVPRPGQRLLA